MSTPLTPGHVYYGPGEQRLRLLSVEDGVATCEWPMSHDRKVMPLHEFEEWIASSERRTYSHRTLKTEDEQPEVRTKRRYDLATNTVTYHTPGLQEVVTVPKQEWDAWRKGA